MHILLMGEIFFTEHDFYQKLKTTDFSIDRVSYDIQVLSTAYLYEYDLILVEVNNPDKLFFSTLKELRSLNEKISIIVVSTEDNVDVKIRAFQAGIDDYVTIPFNSEELIARCKAVLRRVQKVFSKKIIHIDNLTLNLETHEVFVNHKPVHLTGKEYLILELLILQRGTLISKMALLNHLYNCSIEPDIKIIDVFVCKLRKKLQDAGVEDLISTIWGQGYIFRKSLAHSETNA